MIFSLVLGLVAWSQPTREQKIVASLDHQIAANLVYDGSYTQSGKPKPGTGVCTDVVLRAALSIGIDIQEQMTREVRAYPASFGVKRADKGIDHRRCRTLIYWFQKHATKIPPGTHLQTGDVLFFRTSGRKMIDHVGMIGSSGKLVHHWPGRPVESIPSFSGWADAGRFRFK